MLVIKSPRHYRAVAARAAQTGNTEAAEAAGIGLRAAKIASAIKADGPPLPAHIVAELCHLLVGGAA